MSNIEKDNTIDANSAPSIKVTKDNGETKEQLSNEEHSNGDKAPEGAQVIATEEVQVNASGEVQGNGDTSDDKDPDQSDKINQILDLKFKINLLINNIRDTSKLCDKYNNENSYLKEYIGTLMNSNDIKK
ncbi:hypothetical protein HYPBUDRAFT_166671 [Hyphopichia burtonii NRRL Y-1933]|uniref:Uncharacterized protein n=1 Tax=Hyphopichia burtonii NRRL Y-1933 TaxID=984485 RepID=A0A1E4RLX5_9ASCO|nr:hypothetical protein HYPBUDRAFT_166671 [Hyphopichia burtonii NRRL Y-1933]ODV68262.1 hypothetical protein HYPBUDRAFT_166671 [Hyphopichia burtonii NRRL Y-1933]